MTKTEKKIQRALGTLPPMSKETEHTLKAILRIGGDNWGYDFGDDSWWNIWIEDVKNTLKRSGRIMTIEKV